MSRKILLAGVLVGIMALSENPVMATTHYYNTSRVQPMSQNAKVKQPPAIKNGEKTPEQPKKIKVVTCCLISMEHSLDKMTISK